ncbi:MAG: hypothetical protein FXF47_08985 [Candidatus Mcinerneyibacterium aminivorans]|uniref:Iron-only hydrogenase system regulator n=1 Tax=Candidatus Mcinerneyibacterium aminivorans TaxID=2703815 RepID=A0A5D0MG76_9BACT|nr:MAG: hypothetical protein FXF47_08985 [Candidatus Mcinerneyibacterium aminivorans]
MVEELTIMGVLVTNRTEEATEVQKVLTNHGCSIKTRLGMHETDEEYCSKKGVIILELVGDKKDWNELENKLNSIEGVIVKKMEFEF